MHHFNPLTWKALKALNLTQQTHLTHCVTERHTTSEAITNRTTGTDALHPTNCMPDSIQTTCRPGNRSATPIRRLQAIRQSFRYAPKSLTESVRNSANLPLSNKTVYWVSIVNTNRFGEYVYSGNTTQQLCGKTVRFLERWGWWYV